jgi:isopenicillin-N N-acyltransferase-like protein
LGFLHCVSIEEDAYQRGYALGGQIKPLVKKNLDVYMKRFQHYGLSRQVVLRTATKFKAIFERHDPEMLQEMEGLAKATNSKIDEILALNVRYELLWGSWASCTSFAIMPEASRDEHLLIGQNWDWIDSVRDYCHTWRIIRRDRPDLLCFTEAGIVGPKIGMNSSGLSLNVNGLVSREDGMRKGVPFHLITRRILNSTSMSEVFEFLESVKRAGSANYLIGHKQGEAIDVEAGPDQLGYLYPTEGVLTHTNHFISLKLDDVGRKRFPDSIVRYFRCQHLLRKRDHIDTGYLQTAMRDHFNHPNSICAHSNQSKPLEEREQTNASFIMDLTDQVLLLAKGPPCENQYEKLSLKE